MLETLAIDQVKDALEQFSKVRTSSLECFSATTFSFVCFRKGQKYLYNTLTTTIKDNQTNVNTRRGSPAARRRRAVLLF